MKSNALKFLAGGFVIGAGFFGVASVMLHATGTATFCSTCHSMEYEAKTFAMSSHRNQDCVECHLPHDNSIHYLVAKANTGMVDMYHEVLRDYPQRIELDEDARKLVNSNCIRCHEATMSGVNAENNNCVKCHSRIAHGSNPLEGGIRIQ